MHKTSHLPAKKKNSIVKKCAGWLNFRLVLSRERLLNLACLCLLSAAASAEDAFLPLPQGGPELPVYEPLPSEPRFLKPTKSIKPPAPALGQTTVAAVQPTVTAPTAARLRRLILMPGDATPAAIRQQILASGQSRTPVTVVGMDAPAPVLSNLAGFFGTDVNAHTQKQLLDTVRKGLATPAKAPRRVEVVGWLPTEGVMAVAVYPES